MSYTVNVKWGKQIFKDVNIDTSSSITDFKAQLFSLSGVSPERQKVMIPRSGQLKENSAWNKYKLKNGITIMLMGSVGEIEKPKEEITFLEDLPANTAIATNYQPGLINTGNTCYLNSTIQALSIIPPLQESLVKYGKQNGSDAISKQLGNLMNSLKEKKNSFLPLGLFITTFRSIYPQFAEQAPNGGYMQQDAEECFSMLLQSMRNVPGIKDKDIISELFSGEFLIESKCVENDNEEKEVSIESFQKISVHIENDTSFLNTAIKNRMTEHISKNSSSLMREAIYEKSSKISKLPYYLNIQFVRFFWRQDKNLRAKICKPVDFPFKLDLFEFCTPDLQKKLTVARDAIQAAEDKKLNIKKKKKEKKEVKNDDVMCIDDNNDSLFENDTGLYELLAVISHRGRSADGGHYVAWVKQDEESWLLYDDDIVSVVPTEEIKKLTGHGGADWHIAYLCIYGSLQSKTILKSLE